MKCGIVGLPNVGKSTLFNALAGKQQADAQNYPFCTIEPNICQVCVPNSRLETLAQTASSQKIIPNKIEFIDIAGLVKGASKGDGLGNKFLGHIREVDLIIHVVRDFNNNNILHVHDSVNAKDDLETIETELLLADLGMVNRKKYPKIYDSLSNGEIPTDDIPKELNLITTKPSIYVINTDHERLNTNIIDRHPYINMSINDEYEIAISSDQKETMEILEMNEIRLNQLIEIAYEKLDLITFFTIGPKEAHAWKLKRNSNILTAAGQIHTDLQRGFIRGEITKNYNDHPVTVGKEYIVENNDIIHILFNI